MYVLQSILISILAVAVPILFGYAVMKRFGELRGAALWGGLRDRSLKIVSLLVLVAGLPLLVYYWMHSGHESFRPLWLLHPLIFVCAAMGFGAYCRMVGLRWEAQKRPPGDWIQYRF